MIKSVLLASVLAAASLSFIAVDAAKADDMMMHRPMHHMTRHQMMMQHQMMMKHKMMMRHKMMMKHQMMKKDM